MLLQIAAFCLLLQQPAQRFQPRESAYGFVRGIVLGRYFALRLRSSLLSRFSRSA